MLSKALVIILPLRNQYYYTSIFLYKNIHYIGNSFIHISDFTPFYKTASYRQFYTVGPTTNGIGTIIPLILIVAMDMYLNVDIGFYHHYLLKNAFLLIAPLQRYIH